MEDPRLSRMYLKLFLQKLETTFSGSGLARSGMMTGIIVLLLVAGSFFAYFEKGRGNLTKVKQHLATSTPVDTTPQPGGQDAVVMTRSLLPGSAMPEFLSTTLLPGRGMDVLQITAGIPGQGEVSLLKSGTLQDATNAMTGVNDDADGTANLASGGSFLSPWAGRINGVAAMDGKSISITIGGQVFNLPANTFESSSPMAFGGLLLKETSTAVQQSPMGDGGLTTATYETGDYDGRWPSQGETKVSVLMSSRVIEMSVDVKNVGSVPMPVGIGWAPRFAIPGGDRAKAMLYLPAQMRSLPKDAGNQTPSGKLEAIAGTPFDFNAKGGRAIGQMGLNETFTKLKAPLGDNPMVELRDPGAKYGLRITALTPSIKAIHVFSPVNSDFISISPQMNYDDALGKEWPHGEDTGMANLQPGQTARWKIRLELFPVTNSASSAP